MSKMRLLLAIIQLILIPSAAIAQNQQTKMTVLEFKTKNISGVYALGAKQILEKTLEKQKNIIVVPVKEHDKKQCLHRDCLAAIGRKYNVDTVITGRIGSFQGKTKIVLQSFNTQRGQLDYETAITFEPASNIDQAVNRLVIKYIHDVFERLKAPSIVKATIAQEAITVSWKKNNAASQYVVYRANKKDGNYEKVAVTNKTNYADTAVSRGDKYYYKIQSLDDKGFSPYSTSVYGIRAYSETGFYLRGLLPGWGQLYYGRTMKGTLILSAFALSCVSTGILYQNYKNKQADYVNYNPSPAYPGDTNYKAGFDSRYDAYNQAYQLFLFSTVITGIIYAANWIDLLFFTDPVYDRPHKQTSESTQSTYININSYVAATERRTEVSIGLRF